MTLGHSYPANGVPQRHSPQGQNGVQQHYGFEMPAANGQTQQFTTQPQQPAKQRQPEPQQRRQPTPPHPTAEMIPTVANEFVAMYYNQIFNCEPGSLFKFYMDNSTVSVSDDHGVRTARGTVPIRKLFHELLQNVQARVDRFLCQLIPTAEVNSQQGPPILIQAAGAVTMKGRLYSFTQSFILVSHTVNGYYVQNDIMQLTPAAVVPATLTKPEEFAAAAAAAGSYPMPPATAPPSTWTVTQSNPPQVLMPSMDPVMATFNGQPSMNGNQMATFTARAVQQPTNLQNNLQNSMKVVAPPPVTATPVSAAAPAPQQPIQPQAVRPTPIGPPHHQPVNPPAPHQPSMHLPPQHAASQAADGAAVPPPPPRAATQQQAAAVTSSESAKAPAVAGPGQAEAARARAVTAQQEPTTAAAHDAAPAERKRHEPKASVEARPQASADTRQPAPATDAKAADARQAPQPQQPASWASVAKARPQGPPSPQPQQQAAGTPKGQRPSASSAAAAAATAALGTNAAAVISGPAKPAGSDEAATAPASGSAAIPSWAPTANAPASNARPAQPHAPATRRTEPAPAQARGGDQERARRQPAPAATPAQKSTTLVIHDLPESVTRAELVDIFQVYGNIVAPNTFELAMHKPGVWHAYIVFENRESVEAAVEAANKQPMLVHGTKIKLRLGSQEQKDKRSHKNGLRRDHAAVRDQQSGSAASSVTSQAAQGATGDDASKQEAANGSQKPQRERGPRREDRKPEGRPRSEGRDGNRSRRGRGRGGSRGGNAAAAAAGQPKAAVAAAPAAPQPVA